MVGEMETKEKPKPTPDYLMQLMNDKKLMSSLPNFCGIFNHLERLLDEGESPRRPLAARAQAAAPLPGTRRPPACWEGGKVAAGGDRPPGTERPGRGAWRRRRGRARGARRRAGRGRWRGRDPLAGRPLPPPRTPDPRPRASCRRRPSWCAGEGCGASPLASPASSRACEHRDGPELRGPAREDPGLARPAPRGRLKDTGPRALPEGSFPEDAAGSQSGGSSGAFAFLEFVRLADTRGE